jgi:hypothetical protein
MDTDHFVKVFDILDSGYRDWTFPAFGLIFIVVGIVILAFPKFLKAIGIPYLNLKSTFSRYFFLGFAVLWTTFAFLQTYLIYLHHRSLTQENRCRVVEGPVEGFVPMPYGGHAQEIFYVSGVRFSYSDFEITDGFNNTSSHGGPINASSYVRICYDPAGNVILRLEIRDFKRELKDYGKAQNSSPWYDLRKENEKNPPIKVPWDVNLFFLVNPFVFLVILFDFVAIVALFPLYLRTFFRIKAMAPSNCSVPAGLEPNKKTKLRNSMIYWDTTQQVVWLRPRGYNLFQIPSGAAMLKLDEGGTSIRASEIRLSPGIPVVMILIMIVFVWTVYRVSSSMQVAGVAALMVLIVGTLGFSRLVSRMTILVDDALDELKEMRGPWG